MRSITKPVLTFARRRPALVFGLVVVWTIAGAVMVSRTRFDANVLRLLPRHTQSVNDFQQFLSDFGSLDHLYLVFESNDAIGEHQDFVDAYVAALRSAPEIESVDAQIFEAGKDWNYLADRELYLLAPESAEDALARLRPPRLDAELAHARELLSMPSPQIKSMVQQDPVGLLGLLRTRIGSEKGFMSFDPSREGYVSPDGRSRLVIVKPTAPPFDTDFCKALFARLSSVETAARRDLTADSDALPMRVYAAGSYRVSLEAEQLIRKEGITNAIGSLILLLLVVFAVFRTARVMLYGFVPLALAALLTLGWNGVARGALSPATSGSAGMLFGLGIDGVVLLYLRFLEERASGRSTDEAIVRLGATADSVVLAQLTTAVTFFALVLIDFPTLEDLGSLVGVGILLCCALTLLLFPAMLPRRETVSTGKIIAAPWLGRFVARAATPIVWTSLLATLVCAAAATRLHIDSSIERLQAQTRGALLEQEVAARFSLPRDVLLVLNRGQNLEPLLETSERLADALAGQTTGRAGQAGQGLKSAGIAFMLPSDREQQRVARVIRASRLTEADVGRDLEAAALRLGFKPDTFAPFRARLVRLLNPSERITYSGLIDHGLGSVVSRFILRRDGEYRTVEYLYPKPGVDIENLRKLIRAIDPQLRLTGIPVIDHDLRLQFFAQFLKGIAVGTVAVAILIYLVFRTVKHTLLALLPTALGFVWSAGILALAGVNLDLFSLFAAVTFIGIAVDYGIYVLYRYVLERAGALSDVIATTGVAIVLACATALIGFGTLVNSSYAPLHVFGIVSVVTLSCCLTASVVTLPALLRWMER